MTLLSLLIFTPIGIATLMVLLRAQGQLLRTLTLVSMLTVGALTLWMIMEYVTLGQTTLLYKAPWITRYGIYYHIGYDAFSLSIMALIALITTVTYFLLLNRSNRGMLVGLLLAQGGATGALFSFDLILFYLFWEVMLLPIFFMIALYGTGHRVRVAMVLLLYTIFGSIAMLFGILLLGVAHYELMGYYSFDALEIAELVTSLGVPWWYYALFLVAFFVKIPVLGLHGWLLRSYLHAPAVVLVILSALMAKLGVYALFRFVMMLFGEWVEASSAYMLMLGLVGMLYFGIVAITRQRIRALFAYASASHMSLIVVGLFTLTLYGHAGALYLIISHALATAGLFLILEHMAQSTSTDRIDAFGGIIHHTPRLGILLGFFTLALIGIPSSSTFVAELLIIMGAFSYSTWAGVATATTLILSMLFLLGWIGRTLYGTTTPEALKLVDLPLSHTVLLSILALFIVLLGLYPHPILNALEPTLIESLHTFVEVAHE
ncbi:MAG: hypothetical protein KU37_04510 [Sulfuricurvum sp. PC08-66]|nr:MAG: hypothetical protein KU37_04510 [Sulfuricurvum sp. PC08-66]